MSKKKLRAAKPAQILPAQPRSGAAAAPMAAELFELPELPEPRAEKRPLPVWLVVLLGVLLFWGDMYVMQHGADVAGKAGAFPTMVFDPFRSYGDLVKANPVSPEQEMRNKGQQVYNFVCVQCHQANGQGLPGQFPPLAGSEWVVTEDTGAMIRIVLNGISGPITVKGQSFNNAMPPWNATLNDQQIAHVLTFVRKEWGNNAAPVTAEEVAKVREEVKTREAPFTAEELKALPAKPQAQAQ